MQSTYDYLVDQIIDLEAYVDKMSMHEFDRDVLETYIKSIKVLAVEIRDFADKRDTYKLPGYDETMQALNNLTIRK